MSSVLAQSRDVPQVVASALAARAGSADQKVDARVAAVVTVEGDLSYLPATLQSLMSQRTLPSTIVVGDCTGATSEPLYLDFPVRADPSDGTSGWTSVGDRRAGGGPGRVQVQLVRAAGATSFADAVDKALGYAHLPADVRALWLLHDDSRPLGEGCLETLVEAWRSTPTASILGTKQCAWSGEGLHDVGRYAWQHQTVSLVVDGEPDQEQYDTRRDVFSVSTAGALVPLDTLKSLGGLGTWSGTFGLSDDLCRRVCLSGGRVVVVPGAAVGHARARFEGKRGRTGLALPEGRESDSSMQVIDAAERYLFTDFPLPVWPLVWLWRFLASFWYFARDLATKRPYAAVCRLCSPFRFLVQLPSYVTMRRRLKSVSRTGMARLETLSASRQQLARWRDRSQAFGDQADHPLLSHLAQGHLHRQRTVRLAWASVMSLTVLACLLVSEWPVWKAVFSMGAIHSDYLLSSAASFDQLVGAATTSWTNGGGLGAPAAATPFLLVLVVFSILTWGHVCQAMALMLVLCVLASALSFWALAGVFTRSNPVRVATGLLWAGLAFGTGAVGRGDLPILTLMAFMPAAFAFVFKAVGLYQTEAPAHPHASVQNAALASLCFMPVILAEPQLLIVLVAVFILFVCLVPRHKAMLVLIPIPSAVALAPTLVNTVRHFREGLWRQVFGDVMIPSSSLSGRPRSASLADMVAHLLGLDISGGWQAWLQSGDWKGMAFLAALLVMVLLAFLALFIPGAMRASRVMWAMAIMGVILAMASSCVAIGLDWEGPVAGSTLPGLLLALMSFLVCICLVAGSAVKPFTPLEIHRGSSLSAMAAEEMSRRERRRVRRAAALVMASHLARALLTALLVILIVVTAGYGLFKPRGHSLRADGNGLPMVAVDYLADDPGHRVLALSASAGNRVGFTTMRTARGDLIDSSPAARAQSASGRRDPVEERIGAAAAELLSSADSSAISTISSLGYGGIFVPADIAVEGHQQVRPSTPNENLATNITASEGTQVIVSGRSGTYFSLTGQEPDRQRVDQSGQERAESLIWRKIWLWSLVLVTLAFCLVAVPRRHDREWERP